MKPIPRTMQAQPAKSLDRYVGNPNYVMEKKIDGFRLITVIDKGGIEGYARSMLWQDLEGKLPHLNEQLGAFLAKKGRVILDAELTTHDDDFTFVGSVMKSLPDRARRLQATKKELQLCVFDVLEWAGESITHFTQASRYEVLDKIFRVADAYGHDLPDVRVAERSPVTDEQIQAWIEDGGEGAMIKNLRRTYVPGKRPPDTWLKVKGTEDADVILMGFAPGKGKYQGMIGAALFGQILVNEIRYRGKASGMDDDVRQHMTDHPEQYIGQVACIRHMGIGSGDGFRHPIYKGLRTDKKPEECTWD